MSAHRSPLGRRHAWWLLAAILAAAAILRSFELGDAWSGKGFKSAFGAFTTGAFARNFYDYGFADSSAMTYFWRLELADGEVVHQWYTHHPVFYAVLTGAAMRAFGPYEWAAILPWLGISLLGIVALYRLFALLWGPRAALLGALLAAVTPLWSWWGTLTWVDGALALVFCEATRHYVRWLRGAGAGAKLAIAAWFFAGGLVDWPAAFLLPSLGLHAIVTAWRREGWRGVLGWTCVPLALALAFGVHRLHLLAVLPRDVAQADTAHTLANVLSYSVPFDEFLALQLGHFLRYHTWPLALLVLIGFARDAWLALRGRLGAEGWIPLVLVPPGLFYVFLFPGRSHNHDFFLYVSFPAFAAFAARAWTLLDARLRRRRALAWIAPAVLLGVLVGCVVRHVEIWSWQRSPLLAAIVDAPWLAPLLDEPDDVLVASTGHGLQLMFYARTPIVDGIDQVAELESLRSAYLARLGPGRDVRFLFDLRGAELFADLRAYLQRSARYTAHVVPVGSGAAFELYDLTDWVRAGG